MIIWAPFPPCVPSRNSGPTKGGVRIKFLKITLADHSDFADKFLSYFSLILDLLYLLNPRDIFRSIRLQHF